MTLPKLPNINQGKLFVWNRLHLRSTHEVSAPRRCVRRNGCGGFEIQGASRLQKHFHVFMVGKQEGAKYRLMESLPTANKTQRKPFQLLLVSTKMIKMIIMNHQD